MHPASIGAHTQVDPGGSGDAFGPDRHLDLAETESVPLASTPHDVPEFVRDNDGSVPSWGRASERFRRRLQADSPHEARFTGSWAERTRARLLRADEVMREWVESTALFTFTGSPFLPGTDQPVPPTAFMSALKASRSTRRQALRRVLDSTGRWIAIRIIGAHHSGYPHTHLLVGSEADLSGTDYEPVMTAHREHSPVAGDGAHGVGAISTESAPTTEESTAGIHYIASDVPGVRSVIDAGDSGGNPSGVTGETEHRVRTATVIEATSVQATRIDAPSRVEAKWF